MIKNELFGNVEKMKAGATHVCSTSNSDYCRCASTGLVVGPRLRTKKMTPLWESGQVLVNRRLSNSLLIQPLAEVDKIRHQV